MIDNNSLAKAVKPQIVIFRQIKTIFPAASNRMIAKCIRAGLDQEKAIAVRDLVQMHATGLGNILKWMSEGSTLEEIQEILEIRDEYPKATLAVISKLKSQIRSQVVSLDEWLAPFEELGFDYPLHTLFHCVEDKLDGDFCRAYQMALDDLEAFKDFVSGKIDLLGYMARAFPEIYEADHQFMKGEIGYADPESSGDAWPF